ncbi:hypothetical protein EI94DRAFT_913223 [Lactarius quietus]|nr:hypothetical protein EI94DRAFT_913223 [Lactarius quietus]
MGRLYHLSIFRVIQVCRWNLLGHSSHMLHSLEAFSRMSFYGLILYSDVPIYAIFTSELSSDHSVRSPSTAPVVHSALPILTYLQIIDRKCTLHRLRSFYEEHHLALWPRYEFLARSGATPTAASSTTLVNTAPIARKHADTSATLLEMIASLSSTVPVATTTPYPPLVLPFQFSMCLARNITSRILPNPRHSWARNDAIASQWSPFESRSSSSRLLITTRALPWTRSRILMGDTSVRTDVRLIRARVALGLLSPPPLLPSDDRP